MSVPYDTFVGAFLSKITELDLLELPDKDLIEIADGYLKRAVSSFKYVCAYDLTASANDTDREFDIEIRDTDLDELTDIISEGMIVQWLKPYVYKQELLSNVLNTRDFTLYSPAELLMRVGNAYAKAQKDYTQMIREYSYNHGDLTALHL
jgi:hypothetical protein